MLRARHAGKNRQTTASRRQPLHPGDRATIAAERDIFMASPVIDTAASKPDVEIDADIVLLAKRHRISAAIVREIMKRSGTTDRAVIEREITKGKARR
jgi:hypothetical protein